MESGLLDRVAVLMSKDSNERKETLGELRDALDSSNHQTNKTRSQTVLGNKTVMDVLLKLSATTSSADVAENALWVLQRLMWDGGNATRLFQEHPSSAPIAMSKLESGVKNATEGVQVRALIVLQNLVVSVKDNNREMATKNPTLVPLLVAKMESDSEQVQFKALIVLRRLAVHKDNAHEMVTKNPTFVPLLVAKVESNSDQVQIKALGALQSLAVNVDNKREMVTNNPTLVRLLVAKVESNSEQVQIKALGALQSLAFNIDNAREMVTTLFPMLVAGVESHSTDVQIEVLRLLHKLAINVDKSPLLVPLLVTIAESNLKQVQFKALDVLNDLTRNADYVREIFTKNSALVPLLMVKVESELEQVQRKTLEVLENLAVNVDNAREMAIMRVPLLVAKVESYSQEVQVEALRVINSLALDVDNARAMVIKNPTLVPLLMTKAEFKSDKVQMWALIVLNRLALNDDNAREMMVAYSVVLIPLLVTGMDLNVVLQATKVIYSLSCSPANRAILRGDNSVVAALAKRREDQYTDTKLFSLLAVVNLFGAEEDSEVLKTDLAILEQIFEFMNKDKWSLNKDEWSLNKPLVAFRYLCVVEHNRQLLWEAYGGKFLTSVIAALQQAIEDKDTPAVENSVSTLAQFSNDTEPLAWLHSNKPQLDEVAAQLAPFPEALKTVQSLLLAAAAPNATQSIPQSEREIRQWLFKYTHGKEITNKLVKGGVVSTGGLKMLSRKSWGELKAVLELNAMQALILEKALRELF